LAAVSESASARYDARMPLILHNAKDIAARRRFHRRKYTYRRVLRSLRIASLMMDIAEEAEPGPDRLSYLWCAAGELANAERFATLRKINGGRSLKRRWRRYPRSPVNRDMANFILRHETARSRSSAATRTADGTRGESAFIDRHPPRPA
jgi:hypothetical protein